MCLGTGVEQKQKVPFAQLQSVGMQVRGREEICISGQKPQVAEGFIMCWLHYDSQVEPLEALHDLPDAQ